MSHYETLRIFVCGGLAGALYPNTIYIMKPRGFFAAKGWLELEAVQWYRDSEA